MAHLDEERPDAFAHTPPVMNRLRDVRAARRDREMLERLVDRLPVLIAIHDPRETGVRLNAEFTRVLGWTEEDAARRDLLALCYPDPVIRGQAREALEEADGGWADLPVTARDGRQVECSWAALRLGDHTVVAMGIDLTERRRASRELRESEQRLRGIFEGAALGIVEIDACLRIVAVNDRLCRMLGFARTELLGRMVLDLTDPRDRDRARNLNGRVLGGQLDLYDDEKRYLRKDGSSLWVHVAVSAVRDQEGRLLRVVGTVEDVTQRRHAQAEQERHAEHEASLRRLHDSGVIGVCNFTLDGRIVGANDRFLEMVGYDRVDLVAGGIEASRLIAPEETVSQRELFDELRERRVSGPGERRLVRKDGTRVQALVGSAMLDEGRSEGIAFVVDLTDQKAAEARLEAANARLVEADRRKDDFLGMLSHELRNPLAPIRNALFILERAAPGSAQGTRAREVAARQLAYLTRLVDDLLDVTRVARGKIELQRGPLDLAALVRRAGEDHRAQLEARGLAFEIAAPAGPVPFDGDEARLAQVLGNLLHNAGKFTPPGGRVDLALEATERELALSVRDTGAGLDPELAARVFEPFVQAEQTLARSEGGLGLGLALVQGIARLHGGSVEVESAGRGRGATFTVRLPR
ncbi:MAG: PAS domain S-box protein [Anaeromyxobacteraceae bacterium]